MFDFKTKYFYQSLIKGALNKRHPVAVRSDNDQLLSFYMKQQAVQRIPGIALSGRINCALNKRLKVIGLEPQNEAAERMRNGIHAALANAGSRTRDLGGTADTAAFTAAVLADLEAG